MPTQTTTFTNTHLDLHIKHRLRIHLQPKVHLHVLRQSLLIRLLDVVPLLLELLVVDELEQAFELVQIAEPLFLGDLERLGDELTELRVALVEPAARGDAVSDVAESVDW